MKIYDIAFVGMGASALGTYKLKEQVYTKAIKMLIQIIKEY